MTLLHPPRSAATATPAPPRRRRTADFVGFVALLVALIPATAGTARGLVVPQLRVSELLVVVLLVAVLVHARSRFRLAPPAAGAIALYCLLYTTLNAVNASRRGELGGLTFVEDAFGAWQYLLIFIAVANVAAGPRFLARFVKASLVLALVHAVVGLLQMADVQAALDLATRITGNPLIADRPDWKAPRSVGLFRSWHAYGGYLAITGTLGAAHYFRERRAGRARSWMLVALLVIALGLVCSLTFAPIVIAAVALAVLIRRQRASVFVLLSLVAAAATVILTPLGRGFLERFAAQLAGGGDGLLPQTIWFRIQVWLNSWFPIIQDNLLTGYGRPSDIPGAFAYAESMYILTLLIGGLPLLLALLIMLRALWRCGSPVLDGELAPAQAALRAVFPVLLVAMLIHPYLADAGSSQSVFVLAAIGAAARTSAALTGPPGALARRVHQAHRPRGQ